MQTLQQRVNNLVDSADFGDVWSYSAPELRNGKLVMVTYPIEGGKVRKGKKIVEKELPPPAGEDYCALDDAPHGSIERLNQLQAFYADPSNEGRSAFVVDDCELSHNLVNSLGFMQAYSRECMKADKEENK